MDAYRIPWTLPKTQLVFSMISTMRQSLEVPLVLVLLTFGFGVVSVPFLMGAADSWDMVGHLSHAQMQKEMFPQIVFWNPYFYSGYEQFTAYPPLFSLLVALLSFLLGLIPAFKGVTVLSWVALPAAVYFMYRGVLDYRRALVGTVITALILVLVEQQIGGTFFSTFVVGNVANALGLLLFILCLGFVLRDDFRHTIPLLALLVLTHMIASVVMSVFIGSKLLLERRGWILFLGYGMAAFWLIPALLDTFHEISAHDDFPLSPFEYLAYVGLLIGFILYRRKSKDRQIDFLVLTLAILFFLVGVLRHLSMELWEMVPMHFHRVKIYSLVVMVPVILRMIPRASWWRSESRTGSVLLPAMSLLASGILIVGAFSKPLVFRQPYEPPGLEIEGMRVFTVEDIPEAPYWHNFRYHLETLGHMVSKGLFIEASPDASFLLSLEQILDQKHEVHLRWGIELDSRVMADPDVIGRAPFLLDVFGIQAVATDRPLVDAALGVSGAAANDYAVIERPDQELVDVPRYRIQFSGGPSSDRDWRTLASQWFLQGGELLVADAAPMDTSNSGSARIASTENHFNSLRIAVDATEPVPVNIRMGYSTKWHAYADGRRLPVYRITPNNLLVMANQDFELRYEPLNGVNWAGLLVAIVSLIGYGLIVLRAPPQGAPDMGRFRSYSSSA